MSTILITGGARSGKSTYAEKITAKIGKKIVYIATSIPFDQGMKDRIKKHRESRPKEWVTIEQYKDFNKLLNKDQFKKCDTVILDCVTVMVSNILIDSDIDFSKATSKDIDKLEEVVFNEIKELLKVVDNKNFVLVTNEVGMGLVPHYKLGSIFRDIQGRVNQYLAKKADNVYLTVSGIPMKVK